MKSHTQGVKVYQNKSDIVADENLLRNVDQPSTVPW